MDAKESALIIKEYREKNGYTKRSLAMALNIPYPTLCAYEYARFVPKQDFWIAFCQLFGISVTELFDDPTAETKDPGDKSVPPDVVYQFLIDAGFISDGRDLSDEDLAFIKAILSAVSEWFSAQNA